jgi:hypothetical protein
MVNIIAIKLSSVLPLVWTEPAAKKIGQSSHKSISLAWKMPTLDRQPFTTKDYKERQAASHHHHERHRSGASLRHLLLELLSSKLSGPGNKKVSYGIW